MASTTPTAPAQVGKGQAAHYVRKDGFHSHTIGCGRLVATELTEQQAAGRKECGPCKRALEALAAEQPAEIPAASPEEAPADDEAHRQALEVEVTARTLALSAHITAHTFQPVDQPDGERIAWTFRTGHGASARYRWVSTRHVLSDGNGCEYRWQAEQAARLARRTGLDEAPMPEHLAALLTEPTPSLERVNACLDQDTVYAKEVGPGRWEVKRGGTFMGTVHDEGARMRRGRYAAWAPYAERRDGQAGFHHDLDAARDAVARAWPVEVAEIAGELGVPATRVLEVAEQIDQEWKPEGRRALLRAEAYTGTNSRVTQAAAAEIRQRLELPDHGHQDDTRPRALCGYADHTAPLDQGGHLAPHERLRGHMGPCPGSCRPARGSRQELTSQHTTAVSYNRPRSRHLVSTAKGGDVVVVDGQAMDVEDLQADGQFPSRVWLVLSGCANPLMFAVGDRLEFRRKVRRQDVICQGCGVYVILEADEAVDGVPSTRLCGMCDRPDPAEMTADQARARVASTHPHAEEFHAEHTENGRLIGYTFRAGRLHSARYGWITAAGTYAQALEDYRSQAAALLPMAVRDEQAARA